MLAVRRPIGRALGQVPHRIRNPDRAVIKRQLRAQAVDLVEIKVQRPLALQPQRFSQDLGGDERIAVAVATDPAADPKEGGHLEAIPGGFDGPQLIFEVGVEPRQFEQERVIVER